MGIKFRKSKKHTSVRRRYASLTSNDTVKLRKLKKFISFGIVNYFLAGDDSQDSLEAEEILFTFIKEYLKIKIDTSPLVSPVDRRVLSIDTDVVDHSFFSQFLRFKKVDLRRIYNLMQFDDDIILDNQTQ